MARKPSIPQIDTKSLETIARQFPSTAPAPLPPAASDGQATEARTEASDNFGTANQASAAPFTPPDPPAATERDSVVPEAASHTPPPGQRRIWSAWRPLVGVGVGLGAFLAGYITAGQPAMAPSTLPSTVDEERARTAAALDAVLAEAAALRAARASADVVVRAGLALRNAAESGQPFAPQIEAVRAAGSGNAPLDQALDALTPLAVGAPTWAELTARFESAIPSVLTAGQEEAAASWSSRLLAPLGWWLGRDERTDLVEARCQTIALAQAALARGDAGAALGAIARLDPQALAALEGWTRAAQNRALLDAKTDRVVVLLTANAFESAAAN